MAKKKEKEVKNELDPQVYFDILKSKKQDMTDEFLNKFEQVIQKELSKALAVGQDFMVKRLAFVKSAITKERSLIEKGINTYLLKEDIEEYIREVADKAVKIIELEFFPRSIPDEIVETVAILKKDKVFDRYYVVFTDYTGEATKNVEDERKRRDPILFGTFEHKIDNIWDIHDRFYFIGDWEDEYCDLTLTKMVDAMSKKGKDIKRPLAIPEATDSEVRSYINALEEQEEGQFILRHGRKQSFFSKVRTAIKKVIG